MFSAALLLFSLPFLPLAQSSADTVLESPQLSQWKEAYPGNWILRRNIRNQEPALLFGNSAVSLIENIEELPPAAVGDFFLNEAGTLFGTSYSAFSFKETRVLPSNRTAQAAKYSVFFSQSIQGIPVEGPGIQIILSGEKQLLAIHSNHAMAPAYATTGRKIPDYLAAKQAVDFFEANYPGELGEISEIGLVWLPDWASKLGETKLCWKVDVVSFLGDQLRLHHRYFLDASQYQNKAVLEFTLVNSCLGEKAKHTAPVATVSGEVKANSREFPFATPALTTVPFMKIQEAQTTNHTFSNILGQFGLNTAGGDLEFYAETAPLLSSSPRDLVINQLNPLFKESFSLSGSGNSVVLNSVPTEEATAVYNCFLAMQKFRDFVKTHGYADLDNKELVARVNDSTTVSPGNAQYTNGEMFFSIENAASGYQNMAFSTVIAHEMGHWLHSTTWLQGTLGNNGALEGFADAWAMYVYDTSAIGRNYWGMATEIRNGMNAAQWCRSPFGCIDPHYDGMPLMGALWDIYDAKYGSISQTAAKQLLPDVTSSFAFEFIDARIRDAWLILDDDDGDLANGTPHFAAIEGAFASHGWLDWGWNAFSISHTPLSSTVVDNQDYTVKVVRTENPDFHGTTITVNTWEIEYSESIGGGTGFTPLLPSSSANEYIATIPHAGSPAIFEYRIHLSYSIGLNQFEVYYPENGYFTFFVGQATTIFLNGFESDPDKDQGWTSVNVGNPSYNDWQRGLPGGSQGVSWGVPWFDPPLVAESTKIWGTDIKDTWDGAYRSSVQSYLESPDIDATHFSGLYLRFNRWLTLAPGDTATIEVLHPASGQAYSFNPITVNENAWGNIRLPIPSAFDNQIFRIRFRLDTDSGDNYGGWNLDDVEIIALGPSPGGNDPSNTMMLRGDTSASVGTKPTFSISGGIPNAQFELRTTVLAYWNPLGWQQQPGSHLFDLGPYFRIAATGTLDAAGNAQLQLPQAAKQILVGTTFCFEAVVDTGTVIEDSNIQFVKVWD